MIKIIDKTNNDFMKILTCVVVKQTMTQLTELGYTELTIYDYDLGRIYISQGDKELTIRMWNVFKSEHGNGYGVEWTLFNFEPDANSGDRIYGGVDIIEIEE